MLSDFRYRLRALFDRRGMDHELDDELRFHIEQETEKNMRLGMPRADAERRARLEFGGVERIKEDARDARGISLVDTLTQDLRYAWRGLRAKPGFTFAVVATLALGVGANTAMFGIVDRMLFRAPEFLADEASTQRVFTTWVTRDGDRFDRHYSFLRYSELSKATNSFDRFAAFGYRDLAIGTGENVREMQVGVVSASFFSFFDARPALGRFFRADEDVVPNGAFSAVISHGLWETRYGSRPDVLGQTLHIGSQLYTIVGVAPEGFVGITEGRAPAAFIPITTYSSTRGNQYYQNHNWTWIEMLAHRRPDVSEAEANSELSVLFARSWDDQRAGRARFGPPADSARARAFTAPIQLGRGPQADRNASVVRWVMGVAAIVLLIACANVANLLLARAVTRRREIAMRLALGVTRARLFQQVLTESLLIALLGGAAGLALAQWGGGAVRAVFLRAEDASAVANDGRTLLFVASITLGVTLLTGLAPAFHALRGDVAGALKGGEREGGFRRSRMRTGLLVFQAALSVILLVGAGLYVRSLEEVRKLRLGYDADRILYLEGNLRGTTLTPAQDNALADRLVAKAASLPGVEAATLVLSVPFWSTEGRGAPIVPGIDSIGKLGRFFMQGGSPSYFRTLGTPILRGRGIEESDRAESTPVTVISQGMAKAIWRDTDAIGRQFRIDGDEGPVLTVVGISDDVRGVRLISKEPEFWYYVPIEQYKKLFGPVYPTVMVRVSGRVEDQLETLRRQLQAELPGSGYVTATPLEKLVAPRRQSWEFGATMFVAFGGLALVLAALGLYSVIAYGVAQRTRELGVRIALGAGVSDVVRMIVAQGLAFAVAGIVIGGAIAFAAAKWVDPMLYRVSPRDPEVFTIVATVLLVVSVIATLRPALRATKVDPTVALRSD